MSEEKKGGTVTRISDRRASKVEGTAPEPAVPDIPEVPPRERNADYKPMVVNRNDVDPFALFEAGRGAGRDFARAALILRHDLGRMRSAATTSFQQLSELLGQVDEANRTLAAWLARPWYRRWFRKPPTVPALMLREVVGSSVVRPQLAPPSEAPAEAPPATPEVNAAEHGDGENQTQPPEPTKPVVH